MDLKKNHFGVPAAQNCQSTLLHFSTCGDGLAQLRIFWVHLWLEKLFVTGYTSEDRKIKTG